MPAPRPTGWPRWLSGTVQAALLTQPFDFRAAADGYKKLLDIGAYGKEYGFLTCSPGRNGCATTRTPRAPTSRRCRTRSTGCTTRPTAARQSRFSARATQLSPEIAAQTYDYYVKELQPFCRKLAIPADIIPTTVKTLIELGDIKPEAVSAKYVDLNYLPR